MFTSTYVSPALQVREGNPKLGKESRVMQVGMSRIELLLRLLNLAKLLSAKGADAKP